MTTGETNRQLWVNDRPLTWAALRDDFATSAAGLSAYFVDTLNFCRRWLNGESEFVLYTSGSTGTPKPIVLQREQMAASARMTGAALGLRPGMRALVCLNTAYIAGVMMLVRGFELGLEMVIVEPTSRPLRNWPLAAACDFTALVPLQLHATLAAAPDRARLAALHAVLVGGAPLAPDLEAALADVPAAIYHTYGMTETVTHVALRRLNGPRTDNRFHPLPGVTFDCDARGCLTIRGPQTLGKTIVTNDRVALRPDGSFRWLGRIDNVINSGGVKVQAENVEQVLQQLLPQRRLFVIGRPDPVLGQAVTAVIEGPPPEGDLAAQVAASALNRFERPRRLLFVDHFAETPTGKIDRLATLDRIRSTEGQPV